MSSGWPAEMDRRHSLPASPAGMTLRSCVFPPEREITSRWTWDWIATMWSARSTRSGKRWSAASIWVLLGDRVFVNNATVGLYAKIVQSKEYRERKVGTALEMLPSMLGPRAAPFDLRFTGPDRTEHRSAHVILVSNDRYELGPAEGFGSRRRLDAGTLGIVAAQFGSAREAATFADQQESRPRHRPRGWLEWSDTSFEVRSDGPIEVGIDGEAMLLESPLRFRIVPGALRVRIPRHAPGYSPAARVATPGWATVRALMQVAAGRPVTIEP